MAERMAKITGKDKMAGASIVTTCCTAGGMHAGGTGVAGKASVIMQSKKLDNYFFLPCTHIPSFFVLTVAGQC